MARNNVISERPWWLVPLVAALTALLENPVGTTPVSGLGKEVCAQCGPGTYLKAENNCMICLPCTPPPLSGSRKKVINNCTEYSDTEIGCDEGTYRQNQPMGMFDCTSCTKCADDEVETRPCADSHNRMCEKEPRKIYYPTKAAPTSVQTGTVDDSLAKSPDLETSGGDDSLDPAIAIPAVGFVIVVFIGFVVYVRRRCRNRHGGLHNDNNSMPAQSKFPQNNESEIKDEASATAPLDPAAVADE